MTRGQRRILGQLVLSGGEFVSVGTLRLALGYSRKFVEKTLLGLYWKPPKGFTLFRMYDREADDWFYRVNTQGGSDGVHVRDG